MSRVIRQIVLDTETTGMNKEKPYYKGHRIIEIGAVEIINRRLTNRYFHTYLNPGCSIDPEAFNIHGISESFLHDKPKFSEIANKFLSFIAGSELIIHNAPFDISFLNHELSILNNNVDNIVSLCKVIDTLKLARTLFPGKRNTLDALCERYCVDNSDRNSHNALLDATILSNIFLLMTGGQISMCFMKDDPDSYMVDNISYRKSLCESKKIIRPDMKIIYASSDEVLLHEQYLNLLQKNSEGLCMWRNKYLISDK